VTPSGRCFSGVTAARFRRGAALVRAALPGCGQLIGIAVHIGSRVLGIAQPGEVLVSSTVRDLVAGSGIEFDDRGARS
jgi:class 3 adenylate cyclase